MLSAEPENYVIPGALPLLPPHLLLLLFLASAIPTKTRDQDWYLVQRLDTSSALVNSSLCREQRHRGMGETSKRHNHYADMHAAMRGHATAVPSGNILKARAVEQGSVIVAAPPDGIAVVLQLPRGNLETVYPRSLVLPAIASAVQVGTLSSGNALCGSSMGHGWMRGVFWFGYLLRGRGWLILSIYKASGYGFLLFKQTGRFYSWTVSLQQYGEWSLRAAGHLAAWGF